MSRTVFAVVHQDGHWQVVVTDSHPKSSSMTRTAASTKKPPIRTTHPCPTEHRWWLAAACQQAHSDGGGSLQPR